MLRLLYKLDQLIWLKVGITAIALLALVARLIWPDIKIDAVTFGLLMLAVLPWLTFLIESAKFPGGWEVKFRDVKAAGEQVIQSSTSANATKELPKPSFVADPNLALVGLRIDIETRIRRLAEYNDIPTQIMSLTQLIEALLVKDVLDEKVFKGLRELIYSGNRAAHGASVEPDVAEWAMNEGPKILKVLDEKLAEIESPRQRR